MITGGGTLSTRRLQVGDVQYPFDPTNRLPRTGGRKAIDGKLGGTSDRIKK